jgi:hypothetical protein
LVIEEIAVLTLASKGTMTQTPAPDSSTAARAQRNDLPYGRAERGKSVRVGGQWGRRDGECVELDAGGRR